MLATRAGSATRRALRGSRPRQGGPSCDYLTGRKAVVGATGFEPATPASRTQYSTRLSYAPIRVTEKDANSNKDCLYSEAGRGAIAPAAASASRCAAARA